MSNLTEIKSYYGKSPTEWESSVIDAASGLLKSQLVKLAIGNASDLLILDLGGGGGFHAREAVDAGARRVDLVDITPEMLAIAKDSENALGREDKIRFFEADVSKPLDHLPLEKYDIVMANWLFDHAETVAKLEGMYRNIVEYMKPGAKFIGSYISDPFSPAIQNKKYGVATRDLKPIPGGVRYTSTVYSNQVFELEHTSMETSYSHSFESFKRFGLTGMEVIPYQKAGTVGEKPEFWQEFLEHPYFVVVQAFKKLE